MMNEDTVGRPGKDKVDGTAVQNNSRFGGSDAQLGRLS